MVDELAVECPNRDAGCEFICQRQLLEAHLKEDCLLTEELCPDPECFKKALRKDILGDNPLCPHRLVVCNGCATEMKASELEVRIQALAPSESPIFFSSPHRRIAGHAPWRQPDAPLAISNIFNQRWQLMLRCALLQL